MKKHLRMIAAPVIVVATIAVFGYYLATHPATIGQIVGLPLGVLALLLVLYAAFFLVNVLITNASLRLYGKKLPKQEGMLFNAYSSLVNFFGPGQSGPVFRGAYLKKRHHLGVKQFTFTVLLYLAFFAAISALLMLVGTRPWWQTALFTAAAGLAGLAVTQRYRQRSHIEPNQGFTGLNLARLFGVVALQVATVAVIYGLELQQVGAHASVGQILSYTGVSNFALFVSLTPGAIGIREAFLVFGQNLHHISTSTIIAANVIDRAVYLLFLGLLFILVLTLHAKDKLHVKELKTEGDQL